MSVLSKRCCGEISGLASKTYRANGSVRCSNTSLPYQTSAAAQTVQLGHALIVSNRLERFERFNPFNPFRRFKRFKRRPHGAQPRQKWLRKLSR
jgi:hypothetical protein